MFLRQEFNKSKSYECEVCQSVVKAEDRGIECEICKQCYHTSCVDITDIEYEVLTTHKIGSIHWYCDTCNVNSVQLLCLVFGLQDRLQKMESDMGNIKNEISGKMIKIESKYVAVREDLKNLEVEKIQDGINVQCKDDLNNHINSVQKETQSEIEKMNKVLESKVDRDFCG